VPLGSLGNTPLLPHYRAGKLKILAQTSAQRSPSLPEVPTYAEAGLKDLVLEQWLGLFFIAGTPAEAVVRLNVEVNRGLADGQVRERYAQNGLEPVGGTADQFARQYRDDYDKYSRLIRELAIKLD
jgi:tripartite-type tricarboxylate transporter receptor subunit TctC